MQAQIKEGIDPIHMKDQPIWPLLRARSYLSNKIEEITEEAHHDPGAMVIKFGVMAFDFIRDFGISTIGKTVVEILGEASTKEHLHKLPPQWHKLIKNSDRRFVSMKSVMHELLAEPDPDEFRDLRPISSDKHVCNFAHSSEHLTAATPTSTFNRLLRSMLLAPYDSTFEYRGKGHALINPANIDQVRTVDMTVHMYAANGIVLHYIPKTKQIYAYYHKPTHVTPNHHLHSRAHEFFTEGNVLRIDASQPDTFIHRMSFTKFEEEMRQHTGKPDLALPSADRPEKPPVAMPGQLRNDNNKPIISYLGIA